MLRGEGKPSYNSKARDNKIPINFYFSVSGGVRCNPGRERKININSINRQLISEK